MTDDIALTEMPGHLIRRLNQQSTSVFQDRIKQAGHDVTSVQFAAMDTLKNFPGLDQASLAKRIKYDRATIGGVVRRLEQKNLIRRVPDETDRRAFRLWLSSDGAALLAALRPIVGALQAEILQGLTEEEKAIFLNLMTRTLRDQH
ncbi:MarR family winged helix-turn-helix transcriptional regulator [Sulfitobacter sp. SK011]|uniref:MarR family winged helix-turn-helix transcriptional regulator n=1 Tax=Sulfitobacter sp. SK011 TaxID=1389004 RepID=UPI0020C7AC7C|nr:MarR family transcriptional regulator [Sulfitobacter sp. SK011]